MMEVYKYKFFIRRVQTMKKKVRIPSVTMFSEYFRCPRCGWTTDGPRLVRGDIAQCPCEKCGHSYLVRVK